jgi:WD40 repeat protein
LEKDRDTRFQTAREVVAALLVIERGDVPQVVAVPVPQPMQVGAQTQNVWESIAADSESVAVPLAERDATEAEVAPARAEPRRASKLPLLLGAGVLLAALAGLVVAVLWAGKTPDVAKKDDEQPPPPAPKEPKKPPEQKPKDKSPDPQPDSPEGKVYPVPANLIGSMTPLKPEKVFSLDWLDPAKHVPAAERYDWQPKELVALLGSHRQRAPNGGLQWVRVSPDGAFALAGGFGLSWKFDLNTGRVSDGPPVGVVSADFRRGASGNKVFDLTDPKAGPVVYSSLGEVRAFLNDELVLAFRDSIYAIRKLDGKGGADVVDSFTQLEVRQFAVSPDAKYLALVMKDESCRVYDLAAGFNKNKFAELPGPEGRTLPFAVTFSYTGRMSVFGRSGDASVGRVWDVSRAPPALVSSGPHGTLTGDGKFLFGGGNESFDVFAAGSNAKPLASGQLHGVGGYFSGGVSSSRDGATTVTAQGGGAIRVWELKPGVLNERNPIRPQTLLSLNSAVSPDGRFAVVREEGTSGAAGVLLNLTDLAARELTVVGDAVGFGPDGSALYTSGAGSSVRRAPDFAPVPAFAPDVTPLCFSPDGKWMVGTSKTELHVWDVSAAQPKRLWAVPGIEAPRAHFTPDGRFLIARNGSTPHPGKVRVWALTATGPKLRYETDTFAGKSWDALSPDGRTLAVCEYAGHSCQLCLYDIELGVPKGRRVLAADLKPAVVEFSTDGRSLLVFDSNLKVLDAGTGAVLYQPPLRGAPHGARFHPDGKHVFVTNADSTTYVLRLPKDVLEKVAGDADRRAIEWVLSVGGIVYAEGDARQLKRADELPAGPFRYHVVLEHNTNIRPEALAVFRDARNLSGFNAHSSNVTDAGLAHLSGAKKLIWLHLNDTAISDAGLKHLEGLQALRQLSLKNTTVTEPALKALKLKLHPDCLIEWDKGAVKP